MKSKKKYKNIFTGKEEVKEYYIRKPKTDIIMFGAVLIILAIFGLYHFAVFLINIPKEDTKTEIFSQIPCCYPSNCPEAINNPLICDCMYALECIQILSKDRWDAEINNTPHLIIYGDRKFKKCT